MSNQQTITLLEATSENFQTLIKLAKRLGFPEDILPVTLKSADDNFAHDNFAQARICLARDALRQDDGDQDYQTQILKKNVRLIALHIELSSALSPDLYQWVARVRNQGSIRMIVIPSHNADALQVADCRSWMEQLLALGFLRKDMNSSDAKNPTDPSWVLYFDIHQYKDTPDWLNARHWANPQNWNKFRW